MITLGVMDLNLALRVPKHANLTDKSTSDEKREMEKWEKSNRINLMVIKRAIPEAFRGTMFDQVDTAKAFLEDLEKRFAKNEKAETSTILAKLISMRYTGKGNIRDYIMEMSDLTSKLKALKLDLSEDLYTFDFDMPSRTVQGYKFYDPMTKSIFETGNARFFEDVEFEEGERLKDFVFEEEYVDIPIIAMDNDQEQFHIPDIVQKATLDQASYSTSRSCSRRANSTASRTIAIRGSTRERRNAIPNDYIVFLQEHDVDIV
ncbi:hypothetical protein GH714_036639 [Hevea brasiliensis]|uniref:Uncharacterized protein n=1 Tax=Hevea brasiliensis TaxID=3981 RepID=A0A6A6KM04_HEVBR|nr:hypothetical protein GH714_036639 [Hevea brasiliensis]